MRGTRKLVASKGILSKSIVSKPIVSKPIASKGILSKSIASKFLDSWHLGRPSAELGEACLIKEPSESTTKRGKDFLAAEEGEGNNSDGEGTWESTPPALFSWLNRYGKSEDNMGRRCAAASRRIALATVSEA